MRRPDSALSQHVSAGMLSVDSTKWATRSGVIVGRAGIQRPCIRRQTIERDAVRPTDLCRRQLLPGF